MNTKTIQLNLKKKYQDLGYKVIVDFSIEYENGFYIVDAVAQNQNEMLAILIGKSSQSKIEFLKNKGYTIITIPLIEKSGDGYLKHICGHVWKTRVGLPKECPHCKSRLIFNQEDEDGKTD